MYRTKTCGELRINDVQKEVTLAGWVQTIRKFGSITFIDLRDRYGITQLLFNEKLTEELDKNALGREFVIQAKGTVSERSNKNPNIPTGDIEILVQEFKVLNKSAVPPFTIQDDTDGGDDLRMKYRYLDLRRNVVKKNLIFRFQIFHLHFETNIRFVIPIIPHRIFPTHPFYRRFVINIFYFFKNIFDQSFKHL
jgi:aspartyl-tRNA synthetase